jgi:hypothetical protein
MAPLWWRPNTAAMSYVVETCWGGASALLFCCHLHRGNTAWIDESQRVELNPVETMKPAASEPLDSIVYGLG